MSVPASGMTVDLYLLLCAHTCAYIGMLLSACSCASPSDATYEPMQSSTHCLVAFDSSRLDLSSYEHLFYRREDVCGNKGGSFSRAVMVPSF